MTKRNIISLFVICTVIFVRIQTASSTPNYLTALQSVYGSGSCGTCHVDPNGGGARNTYGTLFESQSIHSTDPVSALKAIGAPTGTTPSPSPISSPTPTPIQPTPILQTPGIGGPTVLCYVISSNGKITQGTITTGSAPITGLAPVGSAPITGPAPTTGPNVETVSSLYGTIDYKEFRLINNAWGDPSAAQSVFSDGQGVIGWSWNNPGGGWNYPEFIIGTDFGKWKPSTSPLFPIQYKNINTWTVDMAWDYPQQPTDSWWDLGFDIYWMDSSFSTKYYNIMIWPQSTSSPASNTYVKDVSDGFNTYAYYHATRNEGGQTVPWDAFVLKNQPSGGGSLRIDIKALMSAISNSQFSGSGEWYIPDIQLGNENTNGIGKTRITMFDMNLNGNIVSLSSTGTPVPAQSPAPTSTPVPTQSPTPTSTSVPTTAELLAKIQPLLVPANRINANTLVTSYGTGTEYIYKLPGTNPAVLVAQSSGAVDCDGQTTTQCNTGTDPQYQSDTSFHQSDGKPLNAATLPFYVLPVVGPYFDYTKNGIQGGQLGAIIYNNNMNYGVFGDECAVNNEIGEVSYAMASSLGINPDPSVGGTTSGVTFIIFTGTGNVISPIESHTQATTVGNGALATLWSQLG